MFPAPFPLTLIGSVNLVTNATTFSGLPDIPLTDLAVSLFGGPHGLFQALCAPASGTATAALTDQNGDKTATVPASFTVSGCPSGGGGSGGGAGGQGGGGGSSGGSSGNPNVTKAGVSGLGSGHPALSFTVGVGKAAAALSALVVELPAGIRFVRHRSGGRLTVTGVTLAGARIKSLSLSHGHLVITLRKAVRHVTVRITAGALKESASLKAKIKARTLRSLLLTVITENTNAKHATIRAKITKLGH